MSNGLARRRGVGGAWAVAVGRHRQQQHRWHSGSAGSPSPGRSLLLEPVHALRDGRVLLKLGRLGAKGVIGNGVHCQLRHGCCLQGFNQERGGLGGWQQCSAEMMGTEEVRCGVPGWSDRGSTGQMYRGRPLMALQAQNVPATFHAHVSCPTTALTWASAASPCLLTRL